MDSHRRNSRLPVRNFTTCLSLASLDPRRVTGHPHSIWCLRRQLATGVRVATIEHSTGLLSLTATLSRMLCSMVLGCSPKSTWYGHTIKFLSSLPTFRRLPLPRHLASLSTCACRSVFSMRPKLSSVYRPGTARPPLRLCLPGRPAYRQRLYRRTPRPPEPGFTSSQRPRHDP